MKTTITENQYGLEINLQPETLQEVSQLARFAKNGKAEKPSVYLSFSGNNPYMSVWMRKINTKKQDNSIRPYRNA